MPGKVSFNLDDAEFQNTMRDYIMYAGKDAAFAMNRTMNNLAVIGFQEADVAQQGEIDRVQTLDWWPRYVATVMVKRKAVQLSHRMEKANAKGKGMRGKTYARLAMLHYTRAEAVKQSARMIRRRSVSIGFVRFFFATLSRRMREVAPGLSSPPSKSFRGFEVTARPATAENPTVRAEVLYSYRSRGEASVKKAEALLQDILDRAKPKLIADMRVYIVGKLAELPRRIRRAA